MTTKVKYRMIDGPSVNVKDFGAIGDGVTDDTATIQAAIDYAILNSYVKVILPSGTYNCDQLKIDQDFDTLVFEGWGAELRLIDLVTPQFNFWVTFNGGNKRGNILQFYGIDFNGNFGGGSVSGGSQEGGLVSINSVDNVLFESCTIRNSVRHTNGIATSGGGKLCVVRNCVLHDTSIQAIYTQSLQNIIEGTEVYNCNSNALAVVTPDRLSVKDCYFHDNTDYGILVFTSSSYEGDMKQIWIKDTVLENNTAGGFQIAQSFVQDDTSVENVEIYIRGVKTIGNGGNSIIGNTQLGNTLDAYAIDSCHITDCYFREQIEFYRAKDVWVDNCKFVTGLGAIRLRARAKNVNVSNCYIAGSSSTSLFNTICFVYENTELDGIYLKDLTLGDSIVSFMYADPNTTVQGRGITIVGQERNNHSGTTPYLFNSELYTLVYTNFSDRADRFGCQQPWGEYKPFWDSGVGGRDSELVFWDGTQFVDALGQPHT